jgi:hypothetical protein
MPLAPIMPASTINVRPVEQQPAAMQDFDPTYDRCGVKISLCCDVHRMTAFPPRTDIRRHA